ncbi:MAG: ATP-binding protein [Candidatus Hydrogenedentes bacterium]|nr:ATP-binding protein [Candidatus Hydrogenedentota bacterium]
MSGREQDTEVITLLVHVLLLIIASAAMSLVALMVRKVFSGTPPFLLALVIWVVFVLLASAVTWDVVSKSHRATSNVAQVTAKEGYDKGSFNKELDKNLENANELPLVTLFFGSFQALAGCIVIFIIPVVIAATTMIRPVSSAGGNLLYQLQGEGVADGEASVEVERTDEDRRVDAAHFPAVKTIESFTFRLQPGLNEALVRELARGFYIDERKNVILLGESGTGKTHLAIALGVAACGQGKMVRFYSVGRLAQELLDQVASSSLEKFFATVEKNDLIILDELGYVPVPQEAVPHLLALVSRLQGRCSVILTTHLSLDNWSQAIPDPEQAKVLADTLSKNAEIVSTHSETFRSQPAAKLMNPASEGEPTATA